MNSSHEYNLTYKTGVSNLELEKAISKDGYYSYFYAIKILKGQFELGEKTIAKSSEFSYLYAKNVLKCRFRLGEELIIKYMNFYYSFEYLVKVMGYNHE